MKNPILITMATTYIIKYRKANDEEFIDAYLKIVKEYNYSTLIISTEKEKSNLNNKILRFEYIFNSHLQISFNDELFETTINDSIVKFDVNSSSVWTNFKTALETVINTRHESLNYPSGNIMCIGDMLYQGDKKVLHGKGTVLYDLPTNKVKYDGDFENGLFDGSGKFYNQDGYITLDVPNISNGILKFIGKLTINYPNYEKQSDHIEIDFYKLWPRFNLVSNDQIITFIMSDNFVERIAQLVWKNEKSLEEVQFDMLPIDHKYNILSARTKELEKAIKNINNEIFAQYKQFIFHCIVLIVVIVIIIYIYHDQFNILVHINEKLFDQVDQINDIIESSNTNYTIYEEL